LWEFHQRLIALRKSVPALARLDKRQHEVTLHESAGILVSRRWCDASEAVSIFHFGKQPSQWTGALLAGGWEKLVDSAEPQWGGPGSAVPPQLAEPSDGPLLLAPASVCLFQRLRSAAE
jgi:maltooligosyltrehalose trehalohydrolase